MYQILTFYNIILFIIVCFIFYNNKRTELLIDYKDKINK